MRGWLPMWNSRFSAVSAAGVWSLRSRRPVICRAVPMKREMKKQLLGTIAAALFGFALVGLGVVGYESRVRRALSVAEVQKATLGPVIGAILTVVGFAAFGEHPRNIVPIMAGVFLGSLAKPWSADDPSILLAALFGTTLAPIAGRFGWHWGVVAGFIHSSAALSVGSVHAGLNLYNNGFAAGLVASVLVPVIIAVQSRTKAGDEAKAQPASPVAAARGDE